MNKKNVTTSVELDNGTGVAIRKWSQYAIVTYDLLLDGEECLSAMTADELRDVVRGLYELVEEVLRP